MKKIQPQKLVHVLSINPSPDLAKDVFIHELVRLVQPEQHEDSWLHSLFQISAEIMIWNSSSSHTFVTIV